MGMLNCFAPCKILCLLRADDKASPPELDGRDCLGRILKRPDNIPLSDMSEPPFPKIKRGDGSIPSVTTTHLFPLCQIFPNFAFPVECTHAQSEGSIFLDEERIHFPSVFFKLHSTFIPDMDS